MDEFIGSPSGPAYTGQVNREKLAILAAQKKKKPDNAVNTLNYSAGRQITVCIDVGLIQVADGFV